MGAGNSDELRAAHDDYRHRFGWPTVLDANRVTLPLGKGICALAAGELAGCDLAAALNQAGCRGPVLAVPEATVQWLFLAESDGTVHTAQDSEVRLLPCLLSLPLPPTITPFGPVRWIYRPQPDQRWLPTCSTILGSVRAATIRTRPDADGRHNTAAINVIT